MRFAIATLGCRVNQVESERFARELEAEGLTQVSFDSPAELYIVNTCTVTQMADKKSRQMLHRARRLSPDALIAATGCFVQKSERPPEGLSVDLWIPNTAKDGLTALVLETLRKRNREDRPDTQQCSEVPHGTSSDFLTDRTRAFLKIQDGCRQFCSYCIIPYVRGELHSVSEEETLCEAGRFYELGFREAVLTGIHLSSYGRKGTFEDPEFSSDIPALAEKLAGIGFERIRLGSLEPGIVTPEWVSRMKAVKAVCPQFHLSLQSGAAATLKRMNRHYTPQQYLEGVELLRKAWPEAALTTDVIVGFPEETEEDFNESLAFLEKVGFAHIHSFRYSRREGTAAAGRKGQIPETVKAERMERLLALEAKLGRDFAGKQIGQIREVLAEEQVGSFMTGYTENYIRTYLPADTAPGEIVRVRITGIAGDPHEIALEGERI